LVNIAGQVIGMTTLGSAGASALGNAIPSNQVNTVAQQLLKGGSPTPSRKAFLGVSLTDATGGTLHGHWVGLHNFTAAWSDPNFRRALRNTLLFTIVSQVIVLVCAGLIAHALTRKFRGRWILRFLILLPWAAPIALSLMAWKWMFDTSYSILNWTLVHAYLYKPLDVPQYLAQPKLAMGSVIAVHTWRILPFAVVIFLAGLASIPKEVDDAAAIDGATGFRKFWSVTLPLQLPIATVALLFGIVFTATDMAVVYILTQGGPPPSFSTEMVTTWAYKTGVESGSLGPGAAISLFLLPVLAVVSIAMLLFARRSEVA